MSEKPVIVITGASRRLGLFLCERFAASGYAIAAISRRASDALNDLAGDIDIFCLDEGPESETSAYSQEKNIQAVIEAITARYSRLMAIVHNASVFNRDGDSFSMEDYLNFFHTHMAVPAQLNEGLSSLLFNAEQPGNIIHITDIFAENPNPAFALYCSTKAGLENLSKSFAKKYAPGIRVNTIQPGPIKFLPTHTDEAKKKVLQETLLPYEGGFMPVYQAICAIIDNPYMTGSAIKIDGGRALGRS